MDIPFLIASATLIVSQPSVDQITQALLRSAFGPSTAQNAVCVYTIVERAKTHLSVYGACGEFTKSNGKFIMRSGVVLPYRLNINASGKIVGLRVPRDGTLYQVDLKNLFSTQARAKFTPAERKRLLQRLYRQASSTQR